MDVIRHYDERIEPITRLIKMPEGVGDNLGCLAFAKQTTSITPIEPIFAWLQKSPSIFLFRLSIPRLRMKLLPSLQFFAPLRRHFCGNRIGQTKSHEIGRPFLFPMRKIPA